MFSIQVRVPDSCAMVFEPGPPRTRDQLRPGCISGNRTPRRLHHHLALDSPVGNSCVRHTAASAHKLWSSVADESEGEEDRVQTEPAVARSGSRKPESGREAELEESFSASESASSEAYSAVSGPLPSMPSPSPPTSPGTRPAPMRGIKLKSCAHTLGFPPAQPGIPSVAYHPPSHRAKPHGSPELRHETACFLCCLA